MIKREEIIGDGLEGGEFGLFVGAGGENDHCDAAGAVSIADVFADFHAVHLRHHVIQQRDLVAALYRSQFAGHQA